MDQSVAIKKLILYEDKFNLSSYVHDIALVVLNINMIILERNARVISLATRSFEPNTECDFSSWDPLGELTVQTIPIIRVENCQQEIKLPLHVLQPGMLCAGDRSEFKENEDCEMIDSNGPLVCDHQLTGIRSWGINCINGIRLPSVYTDVAYYRNWILDTITRYSIRDVRMARTRGDAWHANPTIATFGSSLICVLFIV